MRALRKGQVGVFNFSTMSLMRPALSRVLSASVYAPFPKWRSCSKPISRTEKFEQDASERDEIHLDSKFASAPSSLRRTFSALRDSIKKLHSGKSGRRFPILTKPMSLVSILDSGLDSGLSGKTGVRLPIFTRPLSVVAFSMLHTSY